MATDTDKTIPPGPRDDRAIIGPGYTFGSITEKISAIVLSRPSPRSWWVGFGIAFLLVMVLMYSLAYLLYRGVGIWGVNIPVGWGFAIVNFVWWIGIGHAGTFISAILLLLHQKWRTSINRFTEAMTLFAVACAGMFPLLHLGRPWVFYWLLPYPDTMGLWPQWRSPLVWDVFAVTTYFTVSLIFWFIGLMPDLAAMRDLITERHLDNSAKVMLVTGLMVALGYASEHWMAWYSDEPYDAFMAHNRMFGPYWPVWWSVMACNIGAAQALWWRRVRTSPVL